MCTTTGHFVTGVLISVFCHWSLCQLQVYVILCVHPLVNFVIGALISLCLAVGLSVAGVLNSVCPPTGHFVTGVLISLCFTVDHCYRCT